MASWIDRPLLGFDTETTGTNTSEDRIVTAALVLSTGPGRDREIVTTWLIDPGIPIPEAAQAVHKISTEHAQTYGVQPAAALEEIATALVDALNQDIPIVAFNGGFDLRILDAELKRHQLQTLSQRLGHEVAPVIDPLVLDRSLDRYRKGKRTLTDLCGVYGIEENGNLHTADVDVSATIDVLRAISVKHPQLLELDLAQLHQKQMIMHREWAENFNQFLQKRGKTGDVDTNWP